MNEMRVASMVLAAYLVSSAERTSITSTALLVAHERRVELAHQRARALVVGADDDAVGLHEVLDRGAFLQELRVGDDRERISPRCSSSDRPRAPSAVPTGTVDLSTTTL